VEYERNPDVLDNTRMVRTERVQLVLDMVELLAASTEEVLKMLL